MHVNILKLAPDLSLSRIIHGLWRLKDWNLSKKDLVVFLTRREHLEKVESLFRISSLI